jgi:hypothetical protein
VTRSKHFALPFDCQGASVSCSSLTLAPLEEVWATSFDELIIGDESSFSLLYRQESALALSRDERLEKASQLPRTKDSSRFSTLINGLRSRDTVTK